MPSCMKLVALAVAGFLATKAFGQDWPGDEEGGCQDAGARDKVRINTGWCYDGLWQDVPSDGNCVALHGDMYRNVGSIAIPDGEFCEFYEDQNCQQSITTIEAPGQQNLFDPNDRNKDFGGRVGSLVCSPDWGDQPPPLR